MAQTNRAGDGAPCRKQKVRFRIVITGLVVAHRSKNCWYIVRGKGVIDIPIFVASYARGGAGGGGDLNAASPHHL